MFWDELFVFQFLNLRFPETGRAPPTYRHRGLPAACVDDNAHASVLASWALARAAEPAETLARDGAGRSPRAARRWPARRAAIRPGLAGPGDEHGDQRGQRVLPVAASGSRSRSIATSRRHSASAGSPIADPGASKNG